MLTKKYYKVLAELIGTSRDLTDFATQLEVFLETDNPKFDIVKFREAIEKAKDFPQEIKVY